MAKIEKGLDLSVKFAAAKDAQSGSSYITLSYTSHLSSKLKERYKSEVSFQNSSGSTSRKT